MCNAEKIKVMFVSSLVIGFFGILTTQQFNNMAVSLIVPVSVMFVYIIVGKRFAKGMIEQFSDSIYYIGFLFTLLSLVASLFNYNGNNFNILINNFSIALVTTIIGLAARIYFNNFTFETMQASNDIKKELRDSTYRLTSLSKTLADNIASANNQVSEVTSFTINKTKDLINTLEQELDEHKKHTLETFNKEILKIAKQSNEIFQSSLDDSASKFSEVTSQFKIKMDSIELPEDIFSNKLNKPIEKFIEHFNKNEKVLGDIVIQQRAVRDNTRKIAETLQRTHKKLDGLDSELEGFEKLMNSDVSSRNEIISLSKNMLSLVESTKILSSEIEIQVKASDSIKKSMNNYLDIVNDLPVKVEKINDRLVHASQSSINDFDNIFNGYKYSIETMNNQVSTSLNLAKKHQDEINGILFDSRESLSLINTHLVDSAKYISKKLSS